MTYAWLAIAVIAAVIAACAPLWKRVHTPAAVATAVILIILTAVFDNIMIGLGFFYYAPEHLSGWHVGLAPVEDFSYPIAGAVLLPALWHLLLARRRTPVPHDPRRTRDLKGAAAWRQVLLASRPVSWVNTAFPFAAAYLFATGSMDWVLVVGAVFFLIPYNLAMYGINDVFDYASDLQNPRKGGIEGAVLAKRLHRPVLVTSGVTCLPAAVALLAAGGWATLVSLVISLFAVVAYSAPGLRFKERPFLDSVTSSTHFVSPAVVGFAIAFDRFGHTPSAQVWVILGAFFLWGMAAHAFGAVQDVGPDRAAGIGSVATVIGARWTVRLAVTLWLAAGLALLWVPFPGLLAAAVVLPYVVISLPWWNVPDAQAHRVNASWRHFIALNYGCGFLLTLLLIWVW